MLFRSVLFGGEAAPEVLPLDHVQEWRGGRAARHAHEDKQREQANELCDAEALLEKKLRNTVVS